MDLQRDEFVIRYDARIATHADLIAASNGVGFPAKVVESDRAEPTFFLDAMAKAASENKPIVLDFTASWCVPCQRMLQETFPDAKVARLLEQFVLVKVDTDKHPALATKYGAVALPDIRLLSPDGEELRRFRDFQGPTAFAEALEQVLARANAAEDTLVTLSEREVELRDAFNRDRGCIRMVVVLSPS